MAKKERAKKRVQTVAVKTGFVNPIYAVNNNSYKFKLVDKR
jgi:hypothetical protein